MRHDGRNDGPDARAGDPKPETLLDRQLDELFEQLEIEKAPPSLTRRLQRIPQEQQAGQGWWRRLLQPVHAPGWVLVPATAAALLVIGVFLVQPREPSQEEIFRARQELAVAFSYIDKAGMLTGHEIQSVLGSGLRDDLRDPVKENLSRHIPFTEQSRKEETT